MWRRGGPMPRENPNFKGPIDPIVGRFRFNPFLGRGPIHWLILSGIMLIAAIAIVTAFAIGSFRQRALEARQDELENTLILLARHFEKSPLDASVNAFLISMETSSF